MTPATTCKPLRTIVMADRKAQQAAWIANKRKSMSTHTDQNVDNVDTVNVDTPAPRNSTRTHDHVPDASDFAGIGRGIVHNGYVLTHLHGIVTERVWLARLGKRCAHATRHRANGWACPCR